MPKGSLEALEKELCRRLLIRYPDVEVRVKTASNDDLSVTRATDKDDAKKVVSQILQNTWESADDWFNSYVS